MSDIKNIIEKIKKFRDDRDWMQFHDPKNMAVSITIEAAELLEHFQWKTKGEVKAYINENKNEFILTVPSQKVPPYAILGCPQKGWHQNTLAIAGGVYGVLEPFHKGTPCE